jgi:putative phosphoribosyl transferase
MKSTFRDRTEAGRQLAKRLLLRGYRQPVVLALPRGGIPVGYEIAKVLDAPLDICPVRKIGVPFNREFAIGALVDGDTPHALLDHGRIASLGIGMEDVAQTIREERAELARRERLYRGGRPAVPLASRTVILVDDGIATGWSVRAALRSLRGRGARRIVLAVPVAPYDVVQSLEAEADEIICILEPTHLRAVGEFYDDFTQVGDDEVVDVLGRARWLGMSCLSLPGPKEPAPNGTGPQSQCEAGAMGTLERCGLGK